MILLYKTGNFLFYNINELHYILLRTLYVYSYVYSYGKQHNLYTLNTL